METLGCPGFRRVALLDSGHCRRLVSRLELGRRDVATGRMEPAVVPPIDPGHGGQLDVGDRPPAPLTADELGLAEGKAGLRDGDIVVSLDEPRMSLAIDQAHPLDAALSQETPGQTVRLGILRDGRSLNVDVILGSRFVFDVAVFDTGGADYGTKLCHALDLAAAPTP
jgi:PDZ domain